MQAGVKQAVGPKHTNTSGATAMFHQMLPRGRTHTRSHTDLNGRHVQMMIRCSLNGPSPVLQLLIHKKKNTLKNARPALSHSYKHIPHDLDLPLSMCEDPITLQCLQVEREPLKAGRQADCVSVHTPVPSARRNDPHTLPRGYTMWRSCLAEDKV